MAVDHKRKRRSVTESQPNMLSVTIPLDLFPEILLRLPAIDLGRFRCVSKHFHSLLTDPELIQKHAIQANEDAEQHLLLHDFKNLQPFYAINLRIASTQMSDDALKELPCLWTREILRSEVRFVGSCNGLICVVQTAMSDDHLTFWLFNPLTRESYKVLLPRIKGEDEFRYFWYYGFGFDPTTDDYKIVRVSPIGFLVFSIKNNTWKFRNSREAFSLWSTKPLRYSGQVALLHGTLLWDVNRKSKSIVSFDLDEEKLREIMLPPSEEEGLFMADHVSVLGGRLSVSFVSALMRMTCVWIMEEYGVTESWMKLLTSELEWPFVCLTPICSADKGKIILYEDNFVRFLWEGRLRVYDPKHNKLKTCHLPKGLPKAYWLWTSTIYVETLVSIKKLQKR